MLPCADVFVANCQLAMMSPSKRKSVLPRAAAEEEIIGGDGISDDTGPAHQDKPSSTVLVFEISSDDGFKARADNWSGRFYTLYNYIILYTL